MLETGGNILFLWMQKSVWDSYLWNWVSSDPSCLSDVPFLGPQLRLCAQLTSSAASQDAVSVCPGVVMGKMTALTTVMRRTVRTQV